MKRCARCGETKPCAAFAPKPSNLDGLQNRCHDCAAGSDRRRQKAMGRTLPDAGAVPEAHEYCQGCGEVKPHSEWHRKVSSPDGLASRCRSCRAVDNRVGHLKLQYGLTPAELDAMVAEQQGICCICLAAPAEHVDHCHKTGRVRGVLCFSCNAALGQFKDRPDAIRRAAAYVEGIAWKPTLVAPGVYQLPS
jgi:hypothetical protein